MITPNKQKLIVGIVVVCVFIMIIADIWSLIYLGNQFCTGNQVGIPHR